MEIKETQNYIEVHSGDRGGDFIFRVTIENVGLTQIALETENGVTNAYVNVDRTELIAFRDALDKRIALFPESTPKPTVLKAITHCYAMGDVVYQRVIGIFKPEELENIFKQIREANSGYTEKKFGYAEDVHNYMLEYMGADYYYYSSNYTVGELKL